MDVSITLRTTLSFEEFDVEDDSSIKDIQDIIYNEMSADEIICLAQSQGHIINIDVDANELEIKKERILNEQ